MGKKKKYLHSPKNSSKKPIDQLTSRAEKDGVSSDIVMAIDHASKGNETASSSVKDNTSKKGKKTKKHKAKKQVSEKSPTSITHAETTALVVASSTALITPAEVSEKKSWFTPSFKRILRNSMLFLAGSALVASALIMLDLHSRGRVYPRVYAGPIPLGYLSMEDARQTLQSKIDGFLQQKITFRYGTKEVQLTSSELGYQLDMESFLRKIPAAGLTEPNIHQVFGALFNERQLSLPLRRDEKISIVDLLEKKLDLEKLKPQNAHFFYDEKKKIQIAAEKNGQIIDQNKLFAALNQNVTGLNLEPVSINLVYQKAPVTAELLTAEKSRLLALLKKKMILTFGGEEWKIDLGSHIEALSLNVKTEELSGKPQQVFFSLDTDKIKGFIEHRKGWWRRAY